MIILQSLVNCYKTHIRVLVKLQLINNALRPPDEVLRSGKDLS